MRLAALLVLWCISGLALAGETVRITDKLIVGLYENDQLSGSTITVLRTDTPLEVLDKKGNSWQVKTSDGTVGWMKKTYLTTKKSSKIQLIELQIKFRASQDKLKKTEQKNKTLRDEVAKLKKNKGSGVSVRDMDKVKKELKKALVELAEFKKQKEAVTTGKVTAEDAVALAEKVAGLELELSKATDENVVLKAAAEQMRTAVGEAKNPEINASMDSLKLQKENKQLKEKLQQVKALVTGVGELEESWLGSISIVWILVILSILLLAGFFAGITWLDFRQRRRHGGFRVY
jgi:SH3 domain protein